MKLIAALPLVLVLASDPAHSQGGAYTGHGAESLSPEVLAKFAPTPLPPELARRVQVMMDVRSPGLGAVSPDGSRLYFGWSVTGTPQVWRLDGPNRFPVQMTGGDDRTQINAITPDGKKLLVSRDRKGEENPGLYWMNADGGALHQIQHLKGVQTFLEFVSPDGKYAFFRSNDVKPDSYAIYRYDLSAEKKELVFGEPGLWNVDDFRPDGRLLLRKSTGSLSAEYVEYDPATKKTTPLIGQGEKEEYYARYGAVDGQLLVVTPKFGENRRLHAWEKGKWSAVTPEMKWDISGADIDEARTRILCSVNEAGYTKLLVLDARTWKPLAPPKLPADADHVYAGSSTRNGRFTTFGVETAQAPRTSYVYDWTTGELVQWVVPSAPEADTKSFSVATLETYPARDGTKIPVFVRRPNRCEPAPCPVIVEFHGGPEGQAQPGFSGYAQMFVDAGFVFAEPNVRGSDGYGKTWLDADNGPKRLKIITDLEDAATWARKTFAANGKTPKVGVMGGSYGGYSTLLAMTKFAGAYDAGVSIVGISNLVTFLNNTAPYRRILRISEYGDPVKDKAALLELSATEHIAKLKDPLLIIQGATDPRVPAGEAVQMYDAAKKKGVETGLVVFADEGHGAGKRENQVLMIGHALLWMQKHLKGGEAK